MGVVGGFKRVWLVGFWGICGGGGCLVLLGL